MKRFLQGLYSSRECDMKKQLIKIDVNMTSDSQPFAKL